MQAKPFGRHTVLVGATALGSLLSASLLGISLTLSGVAHAATDPDKLPDRQELNRDPAATALLLFDLLEQAELAEKEKDYSTAARNYRAVTQVIPERATGFSKLCEMYQALGERDNGVAACYRATGLPGVKLSDYFRYATLLMDKPIGQALTDGELKELNAVFQHLEQQKVDTADVDLLHCRLAVTMEDGAGMRECVSKLQARLPGHPLTLTYRMSLALFERDFKVARTLIEEARQAQFTPEAIALMQTEVTAREGAGGAGVAGFSVTRLALLVAGATGATALGGGLLAWAKRRRPKAA